MKPGDRPRVEEIFQEALQHESAQRDAYVRQACRGDSDLRREVASLLANHEKSAGCEPWAARAAAQLIDSPTSLQPGQSSGALSHRLASSLQEAWAKSTEPPIRG